MKQTKPDHLFKNWISRSVFVENQLLPKEETGFNISFSCTDDSNVIVKLLNASELLKQSSSSFNEESMSSKILGMTSGNIKIMDETEVEANYVSTERFKFILFGEDNLLMIDNQSDIYMDFVPAN